MCTRWRRPGKWLAVASIVLLLVIGFLPVGQGLMYVLDNRFLAWDPSRGAPDGIVVLGGAIAPEISRERGAPQLNGSAERVTVIASLARDYPNARIVYTGGDASLLQDEGIEADYLYPLLDSFGVPRNRVMLETRARNTYENALFTKSSSNRNRASAGCWSRRPNTCRARLVRFGASDFPSSPIRWTGEQGRVSD